MGALFCLFAGIIWGYWTITDPDRVRNMAQAYLSQIVGGRVSVGKASLSIFEGLRLEGVNVDVDDRDRADSRIFTARTFIVRASPRALLTGNIEAAQILAVAPQVHLCEDLDTGEWNYRRLKRPRSERKIDPRKQPKPVVLPEVLLRAGLIVYSRMAGGKHEAIGRLAIDGNLTPIDQLRIDGERINRYTFDLSSREPMQPHGPRIRGQLDLDRPAISAELSNVEFDSTIRAMLPAQVQQWWDRHQLSGRIRIPQFRFEPGGGGNDFHIAVDFDDVKLTLGPEDFGAARTGPTPLPVTWFAHQPLRVRSASGRIIFTPGQIRIASISGKVDDNALFVSGTVGGYNGNAPLALQIVANDVRVPRLPRYLVVLPKAARKEFNDFLPAGRANLAVEVTRDSRSLIRTRGGGRVHAYAVANIIDAIFCFDDFVYPLRGVTGKLVIDTREDVFTIHDVVGYGLEGGPNAGTSVSLNGVVKPMQRESEVDLRVVARDVHIEPALRSALPEEARDALALFDPAGGTLRMRGDVSAHVLLVRRPDRRFTVDVDLNIADAQGAYESFPYPIRHAQGPIRIRSNHLEVDNVITRNGDASVKLDGTLRWGKGLAVTPSFTVTARAVPIDHDLRSALPDEQGKWLEAAGLRGTIDVDGKIFLSRTGDGDGEVDIGLGIALHNGSIWPVNDRPAVTGLDADLDISLSRLVLHSATAKRGDGAVGGSGYVAWSGPRPEFGLKIQARDVATDKTLYELCPPAAKEWWDRLRPRGRADVDVAYSGSAPIAETVAGEAPADDPPSYAVTIRPRGMSIDPVEFPWLMEKLSGEVRIDNGRVTLKDLVARHGEALLRLSGQSNPDDKWTLALAAEGVAVDELLLAALPEGLSTFLKSIELKGVLSLDWPKITISAPSGDSASGRSDIAGKLSLIGGSMDLGVPLTEIAASAGMSIAIVDGDLHTLLADIKADSLLFAGRPMKALQTRAIRPPGRNVYQFQELRGRIAGGNLDGQIDLSVPKVGRSRYGLAARLKDVDVHELVGGTDKTIRGLLTGNLSLEGSWDNPADRRGRGDVRIQGKELYHVPVVFGLLQIANLAMPIKSPFNEATARYGVEGDKLNLERLELRAANMLMEGSGTVDFRSKQVKMVFTTYNPQWPQIPIIGPLLDTARKELLQIHVTGKVEDPDVKAKSMHTFSTTVEEVLTGDPKKPAKRQK